MSTRQYREAHAEQIRQWRVDHAEYFRQYRETHREHLREQAKRKLAAIKASPDYPAYQARQRLKASLRPKKDQRGRTRLYSPARREAVRLRRAAWVAKRKADPIRHAQFLAHRRAYMNQRRLDPIFGEKERVRAKLWHRRIVRSMSDFYLALLIGVKKGEVSSELIDAKREVLRVKRLLRGGLRR